MTAVHSRAPLEVLSMSAAQRQSRRKTARHLFDDDNEEPPAKRSKVEAVAVTNGASKHASSKSGAARPKKAKTSYDEDEDGFTFARKTRSKKSSDEPVPVNEPQAPQTSTSKPHVVARTQRNDSKTDSRIAPTSSDADPTRPRRRSARLSGDKEEVVQILPSEKPKRKRKSNELKSAEGDRDGSPDLPQNELEVEKKRGGTKIMLPFADTPVINRNKEMRAAKGKVQNRRSSVSSRGRRASSLIESGTSNGRTLRTYGSKRTPKSVQKFASFLSESSYSSQQASQSDVQSQHYTIHESDRLDVFDIPDSDAHDEEEQFLANNREIAAVPHSDVDVKDFYKHIEHSLLEPKRMRQLLTWSATRALPSKAHGGNGNANEIFTQEAARSIIEDLLKDFSNKPEMSDWFSREETGEPTAIVKKSNPRNLQNAARLQKLEEDIARLKAEEKQWNELMKTPKSEAAPDLDDIDLSALDPAQAAIFAELRPEHDEEATKAKKRRKSKAREDAQPSGLDSLAARLQAVNSNLEPQVDMFADGVHKVGQYRLAAERVADQLLSTTARKLEIREKEAQEATGTTAVGGKEVLSALSRALNVRDGR